MARSSIAPGTFRWRLGAICCPRTSARFMAGLRARTSTACFVTDPTALKVRDEIGMDIIAWECDYPHSDSIFPEAPEFLHAEMVDAGCSDEEMHKITWENTCRFFDLDPFQHIPREQASAASLRGLSPDVDTTIRSKHEWRRIFEERKSA